MYLASLTMQGFKSFPDKTEIEFHPGITAIVGPNGSGKSNVMEAVRWVLGEQSAKSLRGGKMEDIIFNGTASRRRMGFTEVTIRFADCAESLGVDYDDIYVTRRYYRSGESEYLINNEACRLKDINELFADTGIGKRGYSIISQGKVDDLLSESGDDRRKIFDEAAGIVKFKLRRKEALRRLNEGEQNLIRSEDALEVLKERERPLERASEKLRRYLKLIEEARQLDFTLAVEESEQRTERLQKIQEIAGTFEDDRRTIERRIQEKTQAIEKIKRERDALDKENEALHLKQLERQGKMATLREQQARSATQREFYTNEKERLTTESENLAGELTTLESSLKALQESLELLSQEQAAEADRFSADDSELLALKNDETAAEQAFNDIKDKLQASERELMAAKEEAITKEASLEVARHHRDNLLKEQDKRAAETDRLQTLIRDTKAQVEAAATTMAQQREALNAAEAELQKHNEKLEQLRERTVGYKLKAEETALTAAVLKSSEDELEGYHQSYRRLVEAGEKNPRLAQGLIGPLGRQITVEKGYEIAIERALGAALHYLIVQSKNDAKILIDWLKQNRAGRETFLPLDHFESRSGATDLNDYRRQHGFLGAALDFVTADPAYHEILEDFLGRILVVDTLDNALQIQQNGLRRYRLVTLDGELLYPTGSISGGEEAKRSMNLLKRRQRLEEAEAAEERFLALAAESEREYAAEVDRRRVLGDEVNFAGQALKTAEREHLQAETQYEQLQKTLQELEAAEGPDALPDLPEIEAAVERLKEKVITIEKQRTALLEDEDAAYVAYKDKARLRVLKEQDLQAHDFKRRQAEDRLQQAKERLEDGEKRQREATEKIEQNQTEIGIFEGRLQSMLEEEVKRAEELAALEADANDQTELFEQQEAKRKELYEAQEQAYQDSENLKEQLHNVSLEKTKLDNEKERLLQKDTDEKNRLWEEYERSWQQVLDEALPRDIAKAKLKTDLRDKKKELKDLGPIQPTAIEEYRELKERLEFLEQQRDDILASQAEVGRLIDRLDREMKERFNAEFEKLREAFQTVFSELFQGGTADLILLDPDDLDSPIDIQAQPPGKRLQTLSLLSGGERALTAIAVLFALFRLRPAPFAVLDEVESALDESNIDRFTAYLDRYVAQTQFILITHRRGTMQAADRLYGVSMKERGVSRLLSLALEENIE